jgi:hypothetical protein
VLFDRAPALPVTFYTVTETIRRPRWHQRLWYWRTGQHVALCGPSDPLTADWVRLLPWRPRALHHWYAQRHGFYWDACLWCRQPYGGHEAAGSVPDPLEDGRTGYMICRRCSWRKRKELM